MIVKEVMETMFEYGAYLGGVVYGFYYMHKHSMYRRFFEWLKALVMKTKPEGPIGWPRDVRIDNILAELRVETRADRAHIFQFHNGDYYDNNSPIRRFSCCWEKLKVGVGSAWDQYQGNLVSGFLEGLKIIIEGNDLVTKMNYKDLPNCLYQSYMVTSGAIVHIGTPLFGTVKGIHRTIGFILLTYNDDRPVKECSFSALHDEGGIIDTDTHEWEPRSCEGTCSDCRFNMYKMRLEAELASSK